MDKLQLCNLAISSIGSGRILTDLDEATPEAEACKIWYQLALDVCLDRHNWSFARRDEIITKDSLFGEKGIAVPYEYAYRIPDDVSRIISLKEMGSTSIDETGGAVYGFPFNFRNIDDVKYIACDILAPFEMHYQAKINDISICSSYFLRAASLQLGIFIAPAIIGGTESFKIIQVLNELFENAIKRAAAIDAQQGSYSLALNKRRSLIESRK